MDMARKGFCFVYPVYVLPCFFEVEGAAQILEEGCQWLSKHFWASKLPAFAADAIALIGRRLTPSSHFKHSYILRNYVIPPLMKYINPS